MRKIGAGLAVLALALCVSAKADGGWGFYGSYWEPSDLDGAFGAGGGISIEVIPNLRLDLRGTAFSNMEKEDGAGKISVDVIPWEATLLMSAPLASRWGIYGGGGIGYYVIDADGAVDADDEIGGIALAGLEFSAIDNQRLSGSSRTTLFAEATGRFVETGDIDLSGIGANLGLMVRW